ncbi:pirin family protein [Paenibacillus sp. GCM10023252]|uniref:pirin family protein n=1 Tax=Paenibacillus sp. GCM10023252 TaxID=3252649 RepID=UPI00360E2892
MLEIRKNETRYHKQLDWLESYHSMSFGDYYDQDNRFFGPLCVFNEDVIAGGRGFGAHPHREMEIITIVLSGQLKHEDSTGQTAVTTFGGVQRMSAGTGIIHSEVNPTEDPAHILQIWITPQTKRLEPSYETSYYDTERLRGNWLPVVSGQSQGEGIAHIHQDTTLYMSELGAGQGLMYESAGGRLQYLFVIHGEASLTIDGTEHLLARGDTVRLREEKALEVRGMNSGALMLLIDLPREGGGA